MCSTSSHGECGYSAGRTPRSAAGKPFTAFSSVACACSESSDDATIARQSFLSVMNDPPDSRAWSFRGLGIRARTGNALPIFGNLVVRDCGDPKLLRVSGERVHRIELVQGLCGLVLERPPNARLNEARGEGVDSEARSFN